MFNKIVKSKNSTQSQNPASKTETPAQENEVLMAFEAIEASARAMFEKLNTLTTDVNTLKTDIKEYLEEIFGIQYGMYLFALAHEEEFKAQYKDVVNELNKDRYGYSPERAVIAIFDGLAKTPSSRTEATWKRETLRQFKKHGVSHAHGAMTLRNGFPDYDTYPNDGWAVDSLGKVLRNRDENGKPLGAGFQWFYKNATSPEKTPSQDENENLLADFHDKIANTNMVEILANQVTEPTSGTVLMPTIIDGKTIAYQDPNKPKTLVAVAKKALGQWDAYLKSVGQLDAKIALLDALAIGTEYGSKELNTYLVPTPKKLRVTHVIWDGTNPTACIELLIAKPSYIDWEDGVAISLENKSRVKKLIAILKKSEKMRVRSQDGKAYFLASYSRTEARLVNELQKYSVSVASYGDKVKYSLDDIDSVCKCSAEYFKVQREMELVEGEPAKGNVSLMQFSDGSFWLDDGYGSSSALYCKDIAAPSANGIAYKADIGSFLFEAIGIIARKMGNDKAVIEEIHDDYIRVKVGIVQYTAKTVKGKNADVIQVTSPRPTVKGIAAKLGDDEVAFIKANAHDFINGLIKA